MSFTISYDPLWATLKAQGLHKIDLVRKGLVSSSALKKMKNCEPVSLNVVGTICVELGISIDSVVTFAPTEQREAIL